MNVASNQSSGPEARHYVESSYFAVPGQSSWNCPVIRRKPRLAEMVERLLDQRGELSSARANPWTARIRLVYRRDLHESGLVEVINETIAAALAAITNPATSPSTGPATSPMNGPAVPRRRQTVSNAPASPGLGLGKWAKPAMVVGVGLGVALTAHIVRRSSELFPPRVVRFGFIVWLATSAGLVWANLNEADDIIKSRRRHAMRELLRFARPYRRHLMISHVTNVISRGATIATVYLIGAAVDAVMSPSKTVVIGRGFLAHRVTVTGVGLLFVGVTALGGALEYYSQRIFMHTAHQIAHDIRVELHAHIQSLEFHELANTNRGIYLTLLNEDINRIVLLFSSTWMVSHDLATSLAAIVAFYLYHPGFAGLVTTPLPGLILIGQHLESRIRGRVSLARTLAADLGGQLSSALDGIETIRANSREQASSKWIAGSSNAYREQLDATVNLTAMYTPIAASAAYGLRALTGYLIGSYGNRETMSTGKYVSLISMCAMITIPIRGIGRDLPHILSTLASLSRVFDAFELPVEDPDIGEALDHAQIEGLLAFRNVDFSYHPGAKLFNDFSVEIPAGRTTAFVGQTGSGKSTLAKLLLRFYEPTGGLITLDDYDLARFRPTDIRRSVAYVGQDIFLFNGSIRQNIAFCEDDEIDDELVFEVARVAEAHEFIGQLPQGYETVVGERGQKLSGGQRQRIGIARALYAPRPIVILDEATSALDSVTEANLYDGLAQHFVGRTVIVIAHRLSAIKSADYIHVLDEGEIVESGSHDELLLAPDSRYARFWALQTDNEDA